MSPEVTHQADNPTELVSTMTLDRIVYFAQHTANPTNLERLLHEVLRRSANQAEDFKDPDLEAAYNAVCDAQDQLHQQSSEYSV